MWYDVHTQVEFSFEPMRAFKYFCKCEGGKRCTAGVGIISASASSTPDASVIIEPEVCDVVDMDSDASSSAPDEDGSEAKQLGSSGDQRFHAHGTSLPEALNRLPACWR